MYNLALVQHSPQLSFVHQTGYFSDIYFPLRLIGKCITTSKVTTITQECIKFLVNSFLITFAVVITVMYILLKQNTLAVKKCKANQNSKSVITKQ